MGRSIRSKISRRNRARLREVYKPKELEKLKATLAFEYNDQTEKAHLSMFHDIMNGPPPELPGLEPGSSIARLHLTQTNVEADRIDKIKSRVLSKRFVVAKRALRFRPYGPPEEEMPEKMDDKEPKILNPKTFRDQFGQYPNWMHRKEIRRRARLNRLAKAKALKMKKKGFIKNGPSVREMRQEILGEGEFRKDDEVTFAEVKEEVLKVRPRYMMADMYQG